MNTYLFDFDGTLVDSMPTYISSMLRILDENNVRYDSDIVKIITPLGFKGAAEYYKNHLSVNKSVDELVKTMKSYMLEPYYNTIPAKNNVICVLNELKKRGDSLSVLTASPHATLDACLKRLGIFDIFDNVWSCDDFGTTKSDPEIYKMAAKKLGKNIEDVIFLDDNLNADKTAKTAGMQVIGVYDKSSDDYVDDIKKITDRYIYDFSELL